MIPSRILTLLLIIFSSINFSSAANAANTTDISEVALDLSSAAKNAANTTLPDISEVVLDQTQLIIVPYVSFKLAATLAWSPQSLPLSSSTTLFYQVLSQQDSTIISTGNTSIFDENNNLITKIKISNLILSTGGNDELTVSISYNPSMTQSTSASKDVFVVVGGLTILPPAIAILLAFLSGEVITSLFVGVWVAAFLVEQYNPASSLLRTLDFYITNAFASPSKVQVILFCWFMSALVCMLFKAGGGYGLAGLFNFAKTRRGVMISTFFLGLCLFWDDYAACILNGMASRTLTDAVFISRERLSYMVHTYATSFASIAPISSWVGFEMSLIQEAYKNLELNGNDLQAMGWETSVFMIVLQTIPSRFYPIFSILFGLTLAISVRDFGLMLNAERRAYYEHKLWDDTAKVTETQVDDSMEPEADTPQRWWNGATPILVTVALVILGIAMTGRDNCIEKGLPLTAPNLFGNGDSFRALLWGSFGGVVTCILLFLFQYKRPNIVPPDRVHAPSWLRWIPFLRAEKDTVPILTFTESMYWFIEGVKTLTNAVVVLVLAWSLGYAMNACGTGAFVSSALKGNINPGGLPALVFIISALISFAIGSSWGTMAIVIPLAIPTSFQLLPSETLMILTISAILAGSIYGDNTTIISDSSILSAMSSRCDVRHHCSSQMPYASINAIMSTIAYLTCGMALNSFPNYAGLLSFGAATMLIAFVLSVPVVGTRIDPLSKIFGKLWAKNKNGGINSIAGFVGHLSQNESIEYRSSTRFNLSIVNKEVSDKLEMAVSRSGRLSKIYSQNDILNIINERNHNSVDVDTNEKKENVGGTVMSGV